MSFDDFTFGFFRQLRQKGMPLTYDQYGLLLDAVRHGLGLEDHTRFMETCCLLWAKNSEEGKHIQEEFNVYYKTTLQQIARDEIKQQQSPQPPRNEPKEKEPEKQAPIQGGDEPEAEGEPNRSEDTSKKDSKETLTEHDAPTIAFYPPEKVGGEGNELDAQLCASDTNYIKSPFILSDDYLSISLRQIQQIWRGLRSYAASRAGANINWAETVQHVARQGVFTSPVYERIRENRIKLVVLIDHHGSMAPHWALGQHLIKAALEDGGHADALVFYTHNLPIKYLYKNPGHTLDVPLETVLAQCAAQHTTFVIFSDAGTSRGLFNAQRVIATKHFLEKLKKFTKSVVWLNPMPRHRWENTSAELIERMTPMYECVESDLEAAVRTLKTRRHARI